jgi:hypothetical protein
LPASPSRCCRRSWPRVLAGCRCRFTPWR